MATSFMGPNFEVDIASFAAPVPRPRASGRPRCGEVHRRPTFAARRAHQLESELPRKPAAGRLDEKAGVVPYTIGPADRAVDAVAEPVLEVSAAPESGPHECQPPPGGPCPPGSDVES